MNKNKSYTSIIEQLRKIKTLAEKGKRGEAVAAQNLLEKKLAKSVKQAQEVGVLEGVAGGGVPEALDGLIEPN